MKTIILSLLMLLLGINTGLAQANDNEVLLNIADDKITLGEFMAVYNKNNTRSDIIDPKTVEEYLELYINFKLKVREAIDLGMDTAHAFVNELSGYRHTLAQPYLSDKDVNEKILKEAYKRMETDLRASHILIRLSPQASPADTQQAYKRIMDIRKRLLSGENFAAVAAESSEDPSARDIKGQQGSPNVVGNGGDLGYFTALDMVYPFENGAYALELNEISMPIRTDFGYHLIKVTERRKAMGQVQVAHIFLRMPQNTTKEDSIAIKEKAFEIREKIEDGMLFDDAVKSYSDDRGSASKGGVLPWFGVNRMVPEFISMLYEMNNPGDISQPVLTIYGWHIIKLLERKNPGTYQEELPELRRKVGSDSRAQAGREAAIANVKNDYKFKEYRRALRPVYAAMDSSIFSGTWKQPKNKKFNKRLFRIDNKTYTQQDLVNYIRSNQVPGQAADLHTYVDNMFKKYTDEVCIKVLDSKLEEIYPEFKALMTEYHDGILLFSLTDEKVWSRAIRDTIGLNDFFMNNRDKYMWGDRVHAKIYTCSSDSIAKLAQQLIKKGIIDKQLTDSLNSSSRLNIRIEEGNFVPNENELVDKTKWQKGFSELHNMNGSVLFVEIIEVLHPGAKSLDESRGVVTADYQNYLEKKWLEELRNRYPVEINRKVLNSIL